MILRSILIPGFLSSGLLTAAAYSVAVVPLPIGFTFPEIGVSGINNLAQISGTVISIKQAFMGSTAGSALIPIPAGYTSSSGAAINDAGLVTGIAYTSQTSQAFIGNAAGSSVVPILAAVPSDAGGYGINNSGIVAGWGNTPGASLSFIGNQAGASTIPYPAGIYSMDAYAINDSREVAGSCIGTASQHAQFQPCVGTTAGSTLVPQPATWNNATAFAINSSGAVAGYGYGPSNQYQAFIATSSTFTAIPYPSGEITAVVAQNGSLNDANVVVGTSAGSGWIWDGANGTRLLTDLAPAGWSIVQAVSINNQGDILAAASNTGGLQVVILYPACDLLQNGLIDISDVQTIIDSALGVSSPATDLNSDGVVNVSDVQIELNAALGLGCTAK